MRFDRTFFTDRFPADEAGLRSEFAPDGTLRRYDIDRTAYARGGRRRTLFIDDERHARYEELIVRRFVEDEGASDDAFETFVRTAVRDVEDLASSETRCDFCEKRSSEVRKIIAGPMSYICDECVQLCVLILSEPEVPPLP